MMRRFLALCYLLVLVSFSCAFRVKPPSSPRHAGPLQQQQQQPEAEGRISSGAPTQKTSETLLDEDDPILAIPNIQESSSSSSSTSPWSPHAAAATSSSSSSSSSSTSTSSSEKEMEKEKQKQKEEGIKKSLGSNVGAAEVEDLLQALDEKEGRLKKKEEEEEARKNSSGVGQLLDEALRLIGKVPNDKLREIFELETKPPMTVDGQSVPITSDMNCETHFRAALEVAWQRSDGDWANLITELRETLGPIGEETTKHMTDAVGFANEMKEEQVKKLIRKFDGVVPKLNTKLYEGKLLKGDYIASLVDVLREQCGGDYLKVRDILEKECKVRGKGSASNKGFASKS